MPFRHGDVNLWNMTFLAVSAGPIVKAQLTPLNNAVRPQKFWEPFCQNPVSQESAVNGTFLYYPIVHTLCASLFMPA